MTSKFTRSNVQFIITTPYSSWCDRIIIYRWLEVINGSRPIWPQWAVFIILTCCGWIIGPGCSVRYQYRRRTHSLCIQKVCVNYPKVFEGGTRLIVNEVSAKKSGALLVLKRNGKHRRSGLTFDWRISVFGVVHHQWDQGNQREMIPCGGHDNISLATCRMSTSATVTSLEIYMYSIDY